jgi:putative ABC transport system permease protein
MIHHLLKLVWNRKRANALVTVEIFFSFLVVFAVATLAISLVAGWKDPLGFAWNDVWLIRVAGDEEAIDFAAKSDPLQEPIARLLREAKTFPQVMDVALSETPPYSNATSEGNWGHEGRTITLRRDEVTDGFANVLQIPMVKGRWFVPADDALNYQPVVIDTDLARDFFGTVDPLGKKLAEEDGVEVRVVGVVAPYRKDGEFSVPKINMMFIRKTLTRQNGRIPRNILVRVRPGTPAAFEEQLLARLHATAPEIGLSVRRMDRMRDFSLRLRATPIGVVGVIALFLIAMVTLGLTGVLWQNVTRRTRELGLRRAVGASGASIQRQVLAEVALLATLAVIIGLILVLQLPLLGIMAFFTPTVFAAGILAALAVIYGITLLCGLYPSWLAARLTPAEALRYE